MGAGYLLRRFNVLGETAASVLADLLINLALPCNIFMAFYRSFSIENVRESLTAFIISIVMQVYCYLLSRILFRKQPAARRSVLRYGIIGCNSGFMGNTVIMGVFGSAGLILSSVYVIPLRIAYWTVGLSCFVPADLKTTVKRSLLHPCIVAVYTGLIVALLRVPLPSGIVTALDSLSQSITGVSMVAIGAMLVNVESPRSLLDISLYEHMFFRLFFIPLTCMLALWLLKVPSLMRGVIVLMCGMPAGSTAAIIAAKYGGDEEYASRLVFTSTLGSLVSLPLLTLLTGLLPQY